MKGVSPKRPRWKYEGWINGKERVSVWAGSDAEAREKIRDRWCLADTDTVTVKPLHVWMKKREELTVAAPQETAVDPHAPPPTGELDADVCKAARFLLGWTQYEVYTRTRASLVEISWLENGRASAAVRDEVFRAFVAAGVDLQGLSTIIRQIRERCRSQSQDASAPPRDEAAASSQQPDSARGGGFRSNFT